MKAVDYLQVSDDQIKIVAASANPGRYSPTEDECGLVDILPKLSAVQVEYLLVCYYWQGESPPVRLLSILLRSESRVVRMNALNALFRCANIPEEVVEQVRTIASAPETPLPTPLLDMEPRLAKSLLSHWRK